MLLTLRTAPARTVRFSAALTSLLLCAHLPSTDLKLDSDLLEKLLNSFRWSQARRISPTVPLVPNLTEPLHTIYSRVKAEATKRFEASFLSLSLSLFLSVCVCVSSLAANFPIMSFLDHVSKTSPPSASRQRTSGLRLHHTPTRDRRITIRWREVGRGCGMLKYPIPIHVFPL